MTFTLQVSQHFPALPEITFPAKIVPQFEVWPLMLVFVHLHVAQIRNPGIELIFVCFANF